MREEQQSAAAVRLVQHRTVVEEIVGQATRPLSVAEIRRRARQHDPSLSSVLLACAATDLRRQGKIRLAD